MALRVTHLSESDLSGGAARAAYRIHRSLSRYISPDTLQTTMLVKNRISDDLDIWASQHGGDPVKNLFDTILGKWAYRRFSTSNHGLYSVAWPETGLGKEIASQIHDNEIDIIHLHWIHDHLISIEEIGSVACPIVWTLHDQWPICGAEHYAEFVEECQQEGTFTHLPRYSCGYSERSKLYHEPRRDLNRITWLRKKKSWDKKMFLVCPSQWMAKCVRSSALMADWPLAVIPNPIDLKRWRPIDPQLARNLLGLPANKHLLCFGAISGLNDPRKGNDLLLKSLFYLKDIAINDSIEVVIFGQSEHSSCPSIPFPVHFMGQLNDDITLALTYSSCDLMMVPSRQDNLPSTATEAHACGIPVVAYSVGGIPDIVDNNITGLLVEPGNYIKFAEAVLELVLDNSKRTEMGKAARRRASLLWDQELIADQYAKLYQMLSRQPIT